MKKGSHHSEETRQKMSEQRKGKKNVMYGKTRTHSEETRQKMSESHKGKSSGMKGKKSSETTKKLLSEQRKGKNNPMYGKKRHHSKETRQKMSDGTKITIQQLVERYPFFSKIEALRYNPINKKEIQVHCKNHNCKNSKEQGGWFTPTGIQMSERIRCLEKQDGNDGSYFYCSQKCKDECILYNLRSDPFKIETEELSYTTSELQTLNQFVMDRENRLCEYCGEKAEHVHHTRPKKLEPFFALDPDYGIAACKKCHYKYGHQGECSTWNIANKKCDSKKVK